MNGDMASPAPAAARALSKLADRRELRPPLEVDAEAMRLLYEWYSAGYIELAA
jgi:hypothetical protein